MPVIKRVRIANPAGLLSIMSNGRRAAAKRAKKSSGARAQASTRKASRKGGVLSMKKNAAKKRSYKPSAKRNPVVVVTGSSKKRNSARRRNPVVARSKRSRRSGYKRNPSFAGLSVTSMLKLGGGALAGGIGTRALTSVVLKDKNVGAVGILSNLGVGAGLTFLASKMDSTVASGVAAGAIASIAQRVWDVYIAKVIGDGTFASLPAAAQTNPDGTPKLGDVSYSGNGLGFYNKPGTWPDVAIGAEIPSSTEALLSENSFKSPFAA